MQLKSGEIFATHYRLKRRLGAGSFGEVWLARNTLAEVDVAIKLYGLLDEHGVRDFREEFKMAYKLNHTNLLHLNHFDVFGQCPFLVMPYCSRGSSASLRGKMTEEELWRFVRDVSSGLAYLHSQYPPVIHQDIKPDNILIGDDGKFLISDFGISRKLAGTFRASDREIKSSGTLAYMGPERFAENPLTVAASDIWSLGMSLYELSTGLLLWEGMGGCVQLNGARIPALGTGYSAELARFVQACLSLNTWDRPTAQQAYEYACSRLRQEPVYAASASAQPASVTPPPPPVASSERPHPQPRLPLRYRRVAGWAVLGIALALSLGKGISLYLAHLEEERQYAACRTEEEYRAFLKEYPSSSHADFIREFLGSKAAEPVPAAVAEERGSEQVAPDATLPLSPPKPSRRRVILRPPTEAASQESFPVLPDKEAGRREEERLFHSCHSIADYERYLRRYPKGRFVYKAKRAIQKIESDMMRSSPSLEERHLRERTRVGLGR